jgi:hypothetical protein
LDHNIIQYINDSSQDKVVDIYDIRGLEYQDLDSLVRLTTDLSVEEFLKEKYGLGFADPIRSKLINL